MNKIYKNLLKAGLVSGSVLFGIAITALNITTNNATAISNELGQPNFKYENKDVNAKYFKSDYANKTLADVIKDGKALAKEIEGEGAVLVENNNKALPLKASEKKVSLFGYTSINPSDGGRGSSKGKHKQPSTDLKTGLEMAGLEVNQELYDYYGKTLKNDGKFYLYEAEDAPFYPTDGQYAKTKTIADSPELIESIKNYGDCGIYILTRTSSEASDIPFVKENGVIKKDGLALQPNEVSILKGMTELKKQGKLKKVVVLYNGTQQIAQKEFENPDFDIDSMLWIGHTGVTGMEAVGEIFTGKINPSGHLPDTFWYDHQDNPVMNNFGVYSYSNLSEFKNHLPAAKTGTNPFGSYVEYQEGVYLGYRYAETRYTDKVNNVENVGDFDYDKVIYRPFGYGESYTDFTLSNFHTTKVGNDYKVTVDVTNDPDGVAGKGVAQIYLQKPYGEIDVTRHIEKPAVELVGYAKTKLLEPGEKQTIEVMVDGYNFASYDREVAKTYITTAGDYLLTAAQDSHEAANNFLTFNGKNNLGNANLVNKHTLEYDQTTYSKPRSETATGDKVTNLFDKADLNKFEPDGPNKIEFMTRSNWTKKLNNSLVYTEKMVNEIFRQQNIDSIEHGTGSYPTYGAKNNLLLIDLMKDENGNKIAYDDPKWDLLLDELTWSETIELIHDGLRCTNASMLLGKPKTKDHNGPTGLTQVYGEGEGLAREKNDKDANQAAPHYPSVPILTASFNKDLSLRYGLMLGEDALWAGYNGFYGIGLNTHRSPYAGRHFEYYSEDPFLSGTIAAQEVIGIQSKGCNAYIKHLALNDQESQRFGIQVWSNEQALREISLRPFEHAVVEGGAVAAMASFSRIGLEFSPASKALLTDFLRGELGMTGFVVTDMYTLGYTHDQMPQFLMAGCDIPDGAVKRSVYEQFKTGYPAVAHQMREAAHRLLYATVHSNAMNGFTKNTSVVSITPPWEIARNGIVIGLSSYFGATLLWGLGTLVFALVSKKKAK